MRGSRLLLVLLLLCATLTVLDARTHSPLDGLRRGTATALGPLERAVGAGVRALPGGGPDGEVATLQRDNDRLRRQLLDLQGAQAQSDELARLLRLKDAGSLTTVLARVVGYGSSVPFESTITLDVGTRDGVRADQSVTTGLGLVGRTVQVGPDTSVVALVTDPTVTVGVRLNAGSRALGLATGQGDELTLRLLAGDAALQVGDAVVTAGSDTFVAGVPVGRVTAVTSAAQDLAPTATLAPYADLDALDLLQVVVDGPRGEPRAALPPS